MKATFRLTSEDFREGYAAYSKSYGYYAGTKTSSDPNPCHIRVTAPSSAQTSRKQFLLKLFPMLVVAGLAIGLYSIAFASESKVDPADKSAVWRDRLFRFGMPAVYVTFIAGALIYGGKKLQKKRQADLDAIQECSLETFESGIRITENAARYDHQWSAFRILAETENVLVLPLGDVKYLIIPKRGFASEADVDAFRQLALEKIAAVNCKDQTIEAQPAAPEVLVTALGNANVVVRAKISVKEWQEAANAHKKICKMGPLTQPARDLHAPAIIDLTGLNGRPWLAWLWRYYWIPLFAGILLVAWIPLMQKEGFAGVWNRLAEIKTSTYLFAGFIGGMILFGLLGTRKAMRSSVEKHPENVLELRDDGIHAMGHSSTDYQWFAFKRAAETPALFLVYPNENEYLIIPKRSFAGQAEVDAFRETLATKIGNRAMGAFPVETAVSQEREIISHKSSNTAPP
jgi:hypothetical protein